MSAEYGKKTVAELTEILKSRGLPSSGKKADLVARLNENDKQVTTTSVEEVAAAAAPEPALEPPPAEPISARDTTTNAAPSAAEEQAKQADIAIDKQNDESMANQTNYALNLQSSSMDAEMAKRKARAERFGTGVKAEAEGETAAPDSDALKNLERAKRFGTGQTALGLLDQALSTERVRGNKRKAEGAVLDDPALLRRGRGGGRFRGRGGRGGKDSSRPTGVSKPSPAYTSDKDRLAAEARRKKFATA